jgi:DNA-binding transcriptional regulator YhcF (GntR family)
MITTDKEFYSSPYYFLLRNKGDKYSLYFSVEGNLNEAREKDEVIHFEKSKGEKVKKHLKKIAKEKKIKDTKTLKTDLEELVNADGAMSNSAIPILDPKLHPRKTMDQTVSAARITNDPISRGYRTYYGESVEEEISEIDMSGAFGYEETEDMDGPETYEYLVKDMGMEPEDAKERTKQKGQDPTGKKDKKSKYYKDKNFITRATLSEIQKQKAIKMVEDLLTKKSSDNSEVGKKVNADSIEELPLLIRRNLKSLLNNVEKHGFSKEDIIKLIKKGE